MKFLSEMPVVRARSRIVRSNWNAFMAREILMGRPLEGVAKIGA